MSSRSQQIGALGIVLVFVAVVVLLQLWLLATSVEAALDGDRRTAWWAALASVVLLGVNGGFLVFARKVGAS